MEPAMSSRTISIPLPLPASRTGWLATGLALGMLAAVLAGPLLSARPILALDPTGANEHTIAVSGTGRIVLSPDIADLRLGVSSTAKTVKAARAAAATSMTAVIASLKNLGIADKDIQTTTLSLQPVYDYAAEGQARQAAMDEAKAKAKTLADAAGISISGVASISETVAPVPYPVYYGYGAAGAPGKDAQTPVQPGSTEVTVTVAVVYLIG